MKAHLCLGANLGKPRVQINHALRLLASDPQIRLLRKSSLVKTMPYGRKDQPEFWNQVVEIDTDYDPGALLKVLLYAEAKLGRVRREKWGPRHIDLDILLCGDLVENSPELVLPHPDLHNRRFALQLLNELIPDQQHPVLHKSIATLLAELDARENQT